MKKTAFFTVSVAIAAFATSAAHGQVTSQLRAARFYPPNMPNAPTTPGGGVVLGNRFWLCDGFESFLPLDPVDQSNPDPVDTGLLFPDQAFELITFVPSCGQVASDGNATVYLADYTQPRGRGFYSGGVKRILYQGSEIIFVQDTIASTAGLAGDNPTALALGPDGNLYVGFLKNGNVKRIVGPATGTTQAVQSVGGTPNGRASRAMAFVGPDLYIATTAGLAVIPNAVSSACQGGCNAVPVQDGFSGVSHVGLTTDGINKLYFSVNNQIWRYTISTKTSTLLSMGGVDPSGVNLSYLFEGGKTNLLQLDRLGNLWIGDDTGDGVTNLHGRIFYISAAMLATVP